MTNNAAAVLAWSLTLSGSEGTKAAEEGAVVGTAQAENNCGVQQGGDKAPVPTGGSDREGILRCSIICQVIEMGIWRLA